MEYYRFGRSLVPEGGLFDDIDSALDFTQLIESDILTEQVQNLSFTTDEEAYLQVLINNKPFAITNSALKDLCKILKVPAGYINKFPGRELVLENLNNNPYLKDNVDLLKLVVWTGEPNPVIAGVLPSTDVAMSYTELLTMLNDEGVFERDEVVLEQIAITEEEMAIYFQLPKEIEQEGYHFKGGFAIHYSSVKLTDTTVHPFCHLSIVASTGEPFDFDFEANKKLHIAKRKQEEFLSETLEICQTYDGRDLGVYYEETMKFATVSRSLDSVKFSILKYLKSKAVSTYNYNGIKEDPNEISSETIPEYKNFYNENKDELKKMETYAANNLLVNFYLPVFFNRIYTVPANIENPYFLIRYRKNIGSALMKILDDVGDLVV